MTTPATDTTAETTNATTAKVGVMTLMIPVLVSTVVTLGAVGGGVFWLLKSGKLGGSAVVAAAPVVKVVEAAPASHVLALEPMIVNLSDAGGHNYLRAAVSLRVKDEPVVEKKEGEKKDPKAPDPVATALRDTTLTVLSKETADALLAPDGRENLKQALEREYKLHNQETPVLEIYFTDFLVQRG